MIALLSDPQVWIAFLTLTAGARRWAWTLRLYKKSRDVSSATTLNR